MLPSKPLVSIGVPVYNGEGFIRPVLDSLLEQTYKNLEIIISDNASTDSTGSICLEYAARDPRVRYYRNPVNIGADPNFRRTIELSSGDYFMWACADDVKPSTAVESCVAALQRNDRASMAHGPVLVRAGRQANLLEISNQMDLCDSEPTKRIRAFTQGLRHNAMLYGLYRRSAVAKATYGDSYGRDYLLCLQMCLLGEVEYVGTPLVIYQERKSVPSDNPMYRETPITVTTLLTPGKLTRRKCWTILIMGCYYMAKLRDVTLHQRFRAISAHLVTFGSLYKRRLVRESVFLLFEPLAWLTCLAWCTAKRASFSLRLARRVQALLRS